MRRCGSYKRHRRRLRHLARSAYDDVFTGTDESDNLYGGEGDDTILSGDGNDDISGLGGDDRLNTSYDVSDIARAHSPVLTDLRRRANELATLALAFRAA